MTPYANDADRKAYWKSKRGKAVYKRFRLTPERKEYIRNWWKTPKGKALAKKRDEKRLRKNREFLQAAKNKPCVDCGKRFPSCCMDFDHVRGKKLFRVGVAVSRSTNSIIREIAKCELVCANCHRMRTQRRMKSL